MEWFYIFLILVFVAVTCGSYHLWNYYISKPKIKYNFMENQDKDKVTKQNILFYFYILPRESGHQCLFKGKVESVCFWKRAV